MIAPDGAVRLILTVESSMTSAGFLASMIWTSVLAIDLGWVIHMPAFHFTASAFTSEPSWNLTPLRSFRVIAGPYSSQDSARHGRGPHRPFSSLRQRISQSYACEAVGPVVTNGNMVTRSF